MELDQGFLGAIRDLEKELRHGSQKFLLICFEQWLRDAEENITSANKL